MFRRAITQIAPLPSFSEEKIKVEDNEISNCNDQAVNVEENQISNCNDQTVNLCEIDCIENNSTNIQALTTNSSRSPINPKLQLCPNIFQLLFDMFLMLPIILANQKLNVTQFNHHPGLFFDGIGKTSIVSEKWHIVTFYNMSNHWEQFNVIQKSLQSIVAFC